MTTRRSTRGLKVAQAAASSSSNRLLSTQTLTLVASWKGQLVICTVVLVVGAIYFVIREPIREWRERQKERLSRAITEELLSMEKESGSTGSGDRHRASTSTAAGSSTAVASAKTMNARERGREKRKEKKRKEHSQNANGTAAASAARAPHEALEAGPSNRPSLADQSPARVADSPPESEPEPSAVEARDASMNTASSTSMDPQPSTPHTNNNATCPSPSSSACRHSESLHSSITLPATPDSMTIPSPLPSPRPTHSCGERADVSSSGASERRGSYSSSQSRAYSIIPDPSYLPLHHADPRGGKKKKRKPKNRSSESSQHPQQHQAQPQPQQRTSAARTPVMSHSSTIISEDSPRSPNIPVMCPDLIRRRVKANGVELPEEVEALLDNHESTIDSLRAEIGRATAEECKARDNEVRTREELRRSRATEDRMRSDYERARKARDRAEQDVRRMEAEMHMIWNRYETLSHMYQAVCQRLRELEIAVQSDGVSPTIHATPQLHPLMAFATNGAPTTPGGAVPYPFGAFPLPPNGFAMAPLMFRRGDSVSSEVLAGPLTPGIMPSTPSGTSSPYPSDLSLNQGSRSHTDSSSMSTAELRRISIASSVLKKKKPSPSENGESSAPPIAALPSDDKPNGTTLEGLGIRTCSGDSSSIRPPVAMTPKKKGSTDSVELFELSTASSSPPAERHVLITPSESEHNGDHYSPKHMSPLLNERTLDACLEEAPDVTPPKSSLVHEPQALENGEDSPAEPMFASLAHTPEQLAEIARMRQSALRDRERRSRTQSPEVTER